jgi:PTH1 family peptidyl-tRNA hydrolase
VKLVVGLGNPGEDYARTRHNVGFLVADGLAHACGAEFTVRKFSAWIAECSVGRESVRIMKPATYMNRSGEAVGPALRFWKLGIEDLVVIHDDLELDRFRVQVKVGGGHGGNNGVKSVNAHVGTPDFARVRVGIGRPPPYMDPADYVLGRFSRDEEQELGRCVELAVDAARSVVEEGPARAMNRINRRRAPGEA